MKRFNVRGNAKRAACRSTFITTFLLILSTVTLTMSASAAELVVNGGFEVPDLATYDLGTRARDKGWTTFYGQNYPSFGNLCSTTTWDKECENDILIPGWSVWWTATLLMDDPNNPGNLILNPAPDEPGRVEIQNNILPNWSNPKWTAAPFFKSPISYAKKDEQKAELDAHDRYDFTGKLKDDNNVTLNQTLLTCPSQPYVLTYWWRSRTTKVGDNDVRVVVGDTVVRTHSLTADWVKETVNFVSDDSYATELAFFSIGTGTRKGMSLDDVSVIGPTPDEFGNCPPPPGTCEVDPDPNSCSAPSSDGSSKDGSKRDGSSKDGGNECSLCSGKGRLTTLTLLYDGDEFSSYNQSSDKASVVPDPLIDNLPVNAYIKVTDEKKGTVLFSGNVSKGQTFDFTPENSLKVEIFDGASLVQTITFHASCSQPLEILDSFGGITIWDGNK